MFRDQRISQITEDHSWVQSRVNLGLLTPEAALTHRMRNLILKSISGMNYSPPDIAQIPVQAGDCFMLCSDGLVEHVMDFEIEEIFRKYDPSIVPEKLINLANSRGGSDNSTVVVVKVTHRKKNA
jgi:serine/threonine protein phosphatase PrpC